MQRFRNYGLWVSLAALVPMACKAIGIDVLPSNYDEIISALLTLLIALGVISNPKEGSGYLDAKTTTSNDITNEIK